MERLSQLNLTYTMVRFFEQYYVSWKIAHDEKFAKQEFSDLSLSLSQNNALLLRKS